MDGENRLIKGTINEAKFNGETSRKGSGMQKKTRTAAGLR